MELGQELSYFQESKLFEIGVRHSFGDSSVFNRKVCVHAILVLSNIFKKSRILFVFD